MAPRAAPPADVDWGMTVIGIVVAVVFVALAALAVRALLKASAKSRAIEDARAREAQVQRYNDEGRAAEAVRRDVAERALAEQRAKQEHWDSLCQRFGQADAARVLRREIWQGQTHQALVESRGPPADVDETVLKTKTKHVFKYEPTGRKQYALRVMLENGVVVGWDDKR